MGSKTYKENMGNKPYDASAGEILPISTYPADIPVKILITGEALSKKFNDFPEWPVSLCSSSPKESTGHGTYRYKKIPGCP